MKNIDIKSRIHCYILTTVYDIFITFYICQKGESQTALTAGFNVNASQIRWALSACCKEAPLGREAFQVLHIGNAGSEGFKKAQNKYTFLLSNCYTDTKKVLFNWTLFLL